VLRYAMVPVLDMENPNANGKNAVFFWRKGEGEGRRRRRRYGLVSSRDIEAGEEIFNSYGSHTNEKVAVYYGTLPVPMLSRRPAILPDLFFAPQVSSNRITPKTPSPWSSPLPS